MFTATLENIITVNIENNETRLCFSLVSPPCKRWEVQITHVATKLFRIPRHVPYCGRRAPEASRIRGTRRHPGRGGEGKCELREELLRVFTEPHSMHTDVCRRAPRRPLHQAPFSARRTGERLQEAMLCLLSGEGAVRKHVSTVHRASGFLQRGWVNAGEEQRGWVRCPRGIRSPAGGAVRCRKETLQTGKLRRGGRKWLAPPDASGGRFDDAFLTPACPDGTPPVRTLANHCGQTAL